MSLYAAAERLTWTVESYEAGSAHNIAALRWRHAVTTELLRRERENKT